MADSTAADIAYVENVAANIAAEDDGHVGRTPRIMIRRLQHAAANHRRKYQAAFEAVIKRYSD